MPMTPVAVAPDLPPLLFGDHPALDFINTRAKPRGVETEWLQDGTGLCNWLVQSGALAPETARRLQETCGPGGCDDVALRARTLREWFRDFVERHAGAPLTGDAVDELGPLNAVLREDDARQIVVRKSPSGAESGALIRQATRSWTKPEQLLQPLVASMAALVCDEDFTRIRHCQGPDCTILFLDRTKNQARRFCSAAGCGNRAKQAAHRRRLQS